ncbi:MAG TPA: hypothetical protein VK151_02260 [Fluviicola sp.]|nr:hypothetical protein [Fluviicola sp.]
MKIILFFIFTIIIGFNSFSQNPPPEELEPTAENKILIDSLVKVSKFDQYFIEFCSNKIDRVGKVKGWSAEEILKRKSQVDFKAFMDYTVYNWFASLTTQDLMDIISLMSRLNKNEKFSWYVFTSSDIENNLDLFISSKYLNEDD